MLQVFCFLIDSNSHRGGLIKKLKHINCDRVSLHGKVNLIVVFYF